MSSDSDVSGGESVKIKSKVKKVIFTYIKVSECASCKSKVFNFMLHTYNLNIIIVILYHVM